MLNIYPANRLPAKEVRKFLFIFYAVGITGFAIPVLQPLFKIITPLALLLGVYLLAVFHNKYSVSSIVVFALIFILGFSVELIGVNTGIIFGSYSYGKTLGPGIYNTPLMIGVNWLFLIYTISSVTESLKIPAIPKILLSSAMMVVYDIVMEHVAPEMDMWSWEGSVIPLKNYAAWFIISAVFFSLLKIFKTDTRNPIAWVLLLCQFLFFCFLLIIL